MKNCICEAYLSSMQNAFSEEFYKKPKISATCTKKLASPLEAYESFMDPYIDFLFEHSKKAMDKLKEYSKSQGGKKFRNKEFKPLLREELVDYFLFQGVNMAYKTTYKTMAQNHII